jgi:hypothetical protein
MSHYRLGGARVASLVILFPALESRGERGRCDLADGGVSTGSSAFERLGVRGGVGVGVVGCWLVFPPPIRCRRAGIA